MPAVISGFGNLLLPVTLLLVMVIAQEQCRPVHVVVIIQAGQCQHQRQSQVIRGTAPYGMYSSRAQPYLQYMYSTAVHTILAFSVF